MAYDDVWFTYKARIAAEVRLKNNDLHSQALLIWYAVALASASIVALRHPKFAGPDTDVYLTILSVGLLALSMFVASRDYRGRSMQMRANHLALKLLYDRLMGNLLSSTEKPEQYAKLLGDCENHTAYDDRYARIANRTGLTSRKPTRTDWALMISMCALRIGALLALYLLPLSFLII